MARSAPTRVGISSTSPSYANSGPGRGLLCPLPEAEPWFPLPASRTAGRGSVGSRDWASPGRDRGSHLETTQGSGSLCLAASRPRPDQGAVSPLRAGVRGAGSAPQPPAVPQPTLCCHPGGAGSVPAEPVASPGTFRCHTAHRTAINRSAGRCVGGCPLAAQSLLQVSPFFSLLHPAISRAPAAGARRALSRRRRHRGRFHPVNGFPVMFNHHQRWRRCSPLALLPHRTLQREPLCLLGSADALIRGCQHGLLAWC